MSSDRMSLRRMTFPCASVSRTPTPMSPTVRARHADLVVLDRVRGAEQDQAALHGAEAVLADLGVGPAHLESARARRRGRDAIRCERR